MPMNSVLIDCLNIPEPSWLDRMEAFVCLVLANLGRDNWEVSLVLCNDPAIATLNADYRGKEGPTDVLSFPQVENASEIPVAGPFLAGDIVISLDTLQSNAEYFNVDPDEEFKRLLIHGILHLSGFDHETNEADEPMLVEQERLVKLYRGETVFTP
jgi:probable rRNA maturation factor